VAPPALPFRENWIGNKQVLFFVQLLLYSYLLLAFGWTFLAYYFGHWRGSTTLTFSGVLVLTRQECGVLLDGMICALLSIRNLHF
jgi:hypothetical protein